MIRHLNAFILIINTVCNSNIYQNEFTFLNSTHYLYSVLIQTRSVYIHLFSHSTCNSKLWVSIRWTNIILFILCRTFPNISKIFIFFIFRIKYLTCIYIKAVKLVYCKISNVNAKYQLLIDSLEQNLLNINRSFIRLCSLWKLIYFRFYSLHILITENLRVVLKEYSDTILVIKLLVNIMFRNNKYQLLIFNREWRSYAAVIIILDCVIKHLPIIKSVEYFIVIRNIWFI